MKGIEGFFEIGAHGSSVRTELLAGISTFLSLSYIFVVNPSILQQAGIDKSVAFFATVVVSSLATLLMGLWARKPFALAPGLEMNAFVAFVIVGSLGFSWQDALGVVFWSGVVMLVVNYLRARENIIKAIPSKLKKALAASVGVFLMLIALKVSGMLLYEGIDIRGIGSLGSKEACVFYVGLVSAVLLCATKVRGAILLSIVISSVVAHLLGIGESVETVQVSKKMRNGILEFNLSVLFNYKLLSPILLLFVIDFYGSIAKFIGLTQNTSIVDSNGNMPKMKEALTVDGLATVVGAGCGTSNVTTYVESAVGIGEGGRTGLTAVVCALLMMSFLLLVPLVNLVPVVATTGALLYVGGTLFPNIKELKTYSLLDLVPIIVMVFVTVWSFGLDKAMLAGFGVYIMLQVIRGERGEVNPYLLLSVILLLLGVWCGY